MPAISTWAARSRVPGQGSTTNAIARLLLEIVTGTLRMQAAIDYQLAARVKRPLAKLDTAVLRVLRMSAFQLIYLSRLPLQRSSTMPSN